MIVIDDRRGSAELAEVITGETTVSRLPFGDFAFIGNGPNNLPVYVGIERKKVRDLISSMISGRLSGHQLPGMCNTYNYIYLVVEGIFSRSRDGYICVREGIKWKTLNITKKPMSWAAVIGFVHSVQIMYGANIWFTASPKHTADLVSVLHYWWTNKEFAAHRSHLRPAETPLGSIVKPNLIRRIAKELPGIGWGKSDIIAQRFNSTLEMINATEEEWRSIRGLGRLTVSRIFEAIRWEREP